MQMWSSCFRKDVRGLIKIEEDLGADLSLLKEVDRINTDRIQSFLGKVKKALWIVKEKNRSFGSRFQTRNRRYTKCPQYEFHQKASKPGGVASAL